MTRYYKAVRPNGTDGYSGTINYAAALGGDPITLPEVTNPQCCTGDVLHASDVATETLAGGSWPCRLFLVEGEPVAQKGHKYGFFSLAVVEEVDARLALGPNADAVISLIDRASKITGAEAENLAAAWHVADAAWAATRVSACDAAREAAWDAAGDDATYTAWRATAMYAAGDAAREAARAAVVRDLISDEHYETLAGPWESVMGPIFKDGS